ncbi:uncharacterized protein TRAVEDRAFT_62657 [Trametes versicolor FP-101664 SS1]|uniref:uncharacterized protein n=1 Tax=Trametes versicolor (strain FP-101664) TaxID=717944 RepID=UPI000462365B|nr:uncharacterized protein TRAVEDRAFT_62657 [Trametes versicolor FP-101664 SS1]EIW62830.1 hypothetical protein TRAVEDRAFT_62657 [Trametes versicolor FP-101664 SS1]
MSSAILRTQTLRASVRAAPAAARVARVHPRTYATIPDPTNPTDGPKPNDIPTPSGGGGNTLLIAAAVAAAAGGGYYYYSQSEDPHAQRIADQERVKQKADELRNAGKATAHDAVREGEAKYDQTKAAGKDKLASARAQAAATADDARNTAVRQYEQAKGAVSDAAHKVEHKYEDAVQKTKVEAQSWNQWVWSWFGYGKNKADDAKREGAQKVVEGAQKVEKEAGKHT